MPDYERELVPKTGWQVYGDEMKADCLALYLKGFSAREARRLLAKKYPEIPPSRTIRGWQMKYSEEIKEAVSRFGEMDMLIALEREGDHLEDISDDILDFAVPVVIEGGKEKFEALPYKDQLDIVLKEVHNKSRRTEAKILRLDPQLSTDTALNVFVNFAKSKNREENGTTATENIIDADIVQG